jgi:hypothetical protein
MRIEQYERIASEFKADIGIAEWSHPFYPQYQRVKDIPEEMKVIALTNFIIEEGIYHQVHRELYKLRMNIGKRRIKESTLYRKAIDKVTINYKDYDVVLK